MSTSRILRLLFAVVATAAFSAAPISAAGAFTQETIVVEGLEPLVFEFGPIPGNQPAVNWFPNGCEDGGGGSTQCDTIPVKVVAPANIGPADDWYVVFTLTWDNHDINDLDMYLWDNQQIKKEQGGSGYSRLDQSATADHPESVKLYAPTRDLYNITVKNWLGPNTGYTITAQMFISPFERPFEVLAPDFSGSSGGGGDFSDDGPPPVDYSAEAPAGAPQTAPPAFGEVAVGIDDDFADFAPSDFDQQIAAPPAPPRLDPRLTSTRPPKDVPALVALFWFAVVPLALIAGAGILLVRHSRSQLALA